jgi:WD40 repeat protein
MSADETVSQAPGMWPPDVARRIERDCKAFEAELRAGRRPRVEEYLPPPAAEGYADQLGELLALAEAYDLASRRPRMIGDYEIIDELGGGGMGIVYRARSRGLDRVVALKVIRDAEYAGPAKLDRFRAEAQALADLRHPNIVQILHFAEHEGKPYYTMELAGGGTLVDRLRRDRSLPDRSAAALVETLARAMHAAHRKGIVHRDLKPANVLFGADGIPKVTDFGLVKKVGAAACRTVTGAVMGTPDYMAPEQARGDAKLVSPATDVWALGVILYECLTGRPPFGGASHAEVMARVQAQEPTPPAQVRPGVARDLEAVCLKCLEKDPANRYPTAGALADDLRRFLDGLPTDRPVSAWRRLEFDLYVKNVALAERARAAGDAAGAGQFLGACPADLRGWEWHCLQNLRRAGPLAFADHQDAVFAVAFGPGGSHLASAADDQAVITRDARSGEVLRRLSGHGDQVYALRFTPDGRRLVASSQARVVKVWDLETGVLTDLRGHGDVVVGVDCSPDGRLIASASDDGTVRLWDLEAGKEVKALRGHTDMVNAVAFSPDGRLLASASYDQTVRVWDVTDGREVCRKDGHSSFVWSIAFGPDGRTLASAGGDETVRVWDLEREHETHVLRGHSGVIWSVAFSPNGARVASAGWDKTVRLWDPVAGREVAAFHGHRDAINSVAFSPDGLRLASAGDDRRVLVWDATPDQAGDPSVALTLRDHAASVNAVAYSPDGRLLATGDNDRSVRLWDAAGGEPLWTARHAALVTAVGFSPDGTRVVSASADKTVRVWDAATGGEALPPLRGHADRVYAAAFSPDGRRLASAGWDRTVRLWDAATGRPEGVLTGHANWVWDLAFDPSGARLASAGKDRRVIVWDLATARPVLDLGGHDLQAFGVAFDRDGRLIASAGADGLVRLWDAATGAPVRALAGHAERVYKVAFDPTGERLASAGEDQTVRVWDLRGGAAAVRRGHTRQVNHVAFSPDGARLASAGDDRTVRVWVLG